MALGEPSAQIFDEATPIVPPPERASRVAIEKPVQTAPGIRSVVLCNSMIYGNPLGPPAESVQLPARYVRPEHPAWRSISGAD